MSDIKLKVFDEPSVVETSKVSESELLQILTEEPRLDRLWNGVLALYTDKVEWTTVDDLDTGHFGNLLELRAYTTQAEIHAVRDALGREFTWRRVFDQGTDASDLVYDAHFDECQYLDIDSTKTRGRNYVTTGGGAYTLPIERAERVLVRNYLTYNEEDGMAHVVDFRIVGLKGENDG